MLWLVAGMVLLNWATWMVVVHRHWGEMRDGAHLSAVGLLVFLPVPFVQMFSKRGSELPVAFFTYLLLSFAVRIAFH